MTQLPTKTKTEDRILRDLLIGPSTAGSLAPRLQMEESDLPAFLDDLELDGLIDSHPLGNPDFGRKLSVYKITPAGREVAATLPQPANPTSP